MEIQTVLATEILGYWGVLVVLPIHILISCSRRVALAVWIVVVVVRSVVAAHNGRFGSTPPVFKEDSILYPSSRKTQQDR